MSEKLADVSEIRGDDDSIHYMSPEALRDRMFRNDPEYRKMVVVMHRLVDILHGASTMIHGVDFIIDHLDESECARFYTAIKRVFGVKDLGAKLDGDSTLTDVAALIIKENKQ